VNNSFDISREIMQQIRLCDCSYVKSGVDLFIQYLKNAKKADDLNFQFIIPLCDEDPSLIIGKIYHYTSADALFGILKSGDGKKTFTIRLSRVDYMNDIYDGKDVFDFIFYECVNSGQVNLSDSFKQYVIALVESLQKGQFFDESSRQVSYISSLSIDGDSLPMWRNYTTNGGGYNISLDTSSLWDCCTKHSTMALIPVVYEYDLMVSILHAMLSAFSFIWERDKENATKLKMILFRYMMSAKLSFKHPSFSHEQEIRLLKIEPRKVGNNQSEKYTIANGIMRPYIEAEIPKSIFSGVTIGPLLEADAAKRTVEDVISAYGGWGGSCKVDISVAPIRF